MSTCKRMWTDREVRSMAVNSVENKTNLKVFENIVDKDGHKRFLEGDITIEELTGATQKYAKWSLSGTHLIIVVAFTMANGSTLGGPGVKVCDIDLPEWISNKIVPIVSQRIDLKTFTFHAADGTGQAGIFAFAKSAEGLFINSNQSITFTAERSVRIVFDLLIDNE